MEFFRAKCHNFECLEQKKSGKLASFWLHCNVQYLQSCIMMSKSVKVQQTPAPLLYVAVLLFWMKEEMQTKSAVFKAGELVAAA